MLKSSPNLPKTIRDFCLNDLVVLIFQAARGRIQTMFFTFWTLILPPAADNNLTMRAPFCITHPVISSAASITLGLGHFRSSLYYIQIMLFTPVIFSKFCHPEMSSYCLGYLDYSFIIGTKFMGKFKEVFFGLR